MGMTSQIDISGLLPAVRVPTLLIHRTGDRTVNVEGGHDMAAHIPGARLVELPGIDHIFCIGVVYQAAAKELLADNEIKERYCSV